VAIGVVKEHKRSDQQSRSCSLTCGRWSAMCVNSFIEWAYAVPRNVNALGAGSRKSEGCGLELRAEVKDKEQAKPDDEQPCAHDLCYQERDCGAFDLSTPFGSLGCGHALHSGHVLGVEA
jgi:hypothetical protein